MASLITAITMALLVLVGILGYLLTMALPLANRIDDDWILLLFPAGILIGLGCTIRFRHSSGLRRIAWWLFIVQLVLLALMLIPVQVPDDVPAGMNELPYAILQLMLWIVAAAWAATGLVSYTLTFVVMLFLDPMHAVGKPRGNETGG